MRKVLPEAQYRFADLTPSHLMYRTFFDLPKVPQIPAISYWFGSGGDTSEQGADSAVVHVRGISDEHGRLMVLATHNTDISDGWEREKRRSPLLQAVLHRLVRGRHQRDAVCMMSH